MRVVLLTCLAHVAIVAPATAVALAPAPQTVTVSVAGPLHIVTGGSATYTVTITGTGFSGTNALNWQAFDEDGVDDPLTSEIPFTVTTPTWTHTATFNLTCSSFTNQIQGTSSGGGALTTGEGGPHDPIELFVLVEYSGGTDLGRSAIRQVSCVRCNIRSVIFEGPATLPADGTPRTYTITVTGVGEVNLKWSVRVEESGPLLIGLQDFVVHVTKPLEEWTETREFQLYCDPSDHVRGYSPSPTSSSGASSASLQVLIEQEFLGTDCAGSPYLTVACEDCYLLLGFSPASIPVPGNPGDFLHVQPVLAVRISSGFTPSFDIPNHAALSGLHLYTQTAMYNPYDFPEDPCKMSQGVDVCLGVGSVEYGTASGMHLWLTSPPSLGGTLAFDFSIGG